MRRLFSFILILVIVLVSLNWFRSLKAQDFGSLTADEKQALFREYTKKRSVAPPAPQYQTPDIYNDTSRSARTGTQYRATRVADSLYRIDPRRNDPEMEFPPREDDTLLANRQNERNRYPDFDSLRPFGYELFDSAEASPLVTDVGVSDDYIVGAGDKLLINLWGRTTREYDLAVDREGKIFVPQVGEMIVRGKSLQQITREAKSAFSGAFEGTDVSVTLGHIRTLRVFVAGEVKRPGAYSVPSLTSLFNAVYEAGGPNERGSLRAIRLMRGGKQVAEFDFYELLIAGRNPADMRLESGDLVFVPVTRSRVAIRGEVHRPAIYELRGNERAREILSLAGNPKPEAFLDRVGLERITPAKLWSVLDLNLSDHRPGGPDTTLLQDGDRITVGSMFDLRSNLVQVRGMVKHPGAYERNERTSVRDIISKAQLQPYDVLYERADLFRTFPDNRREIRPIHLGAALEGDTAHDITLQDRDSLHVYAISEHAPKQFVFIEGEVRRPGEYPYYTGMTVTDLIFLAGSFTRSADRQFAELARVDERGVVSIQQVELSVTSPGPVLTADNYLYIRAIPDWENERSIALEGEVNYPGKYTLSETTETLGQLLKRAGGFSHRAFPEGLVLRRASISRGLERSNVSGLLRRSQTLVRDSLGRVQAEERLDIDLKSMERIIIDMKRFLATDGREGDVTLEPGDKIYVPQTPSGVSVMGAVGSNGTIQYERGRRVRHYVSRAGDFTRQSDKGETRLIRATGEVVSGSGVLSERVELGDVIVVPTRIEREGNLLKTLTTALGAATGILSSVYIISNL